MKPILVTRAARSGLIATLCLVTLGGCARHQHRPSITAIGLSPGNRCDPPGIPYYLPKPLLVVAKNVRHIDESKVGLTGPAPIPGGFDNQAAYADIKANVTIPSSSAAGIAAANLPATAISGATVSEAESALAAARSIAPSRMVPGDEAGFGAGVELDSFFTYQIIFVPDLTQKYGLQISGGAGEFRAAMNMVNGWMYTGMGPFYMKDSSSAQNAMATGVGSMYAGRGASDVIDSVGDLARSFAGTVTTPAGVKAEGGAGGPVPPEIAAQVLAIEALVAATPRVPKEIQNFAEIYIYEPVLIDPETTDWRLIVHEKFNRNYLALADSNAAANARQALLSHALKAVNAGTGDPRPDAPANPASSTPAGDPRPDANQPTDEEKDPKQGRAPSAKPESGSGGERIVIPGLEGGAVTGGGRGISTEQEINAPIAAPSPLRIEIDSRNEMQLTPPEPTARHGFKEGAIRLLTPPSRPEIRSTLGNSSTSIRQLTTP